mmetsp:Transcript_66670/g.171647  ORF Transcript_66670/g.171647 Transcript_66670/m.171647 type:complete len:211 (-) Transcript_66670:815-1447(-)
MRLYMSSNPFSIIVESSSSWRCSHTSNLSAISHSAPERSIARTMILRMSSALFSSDSGASSRTQRPNSASSPELKNSRIMVCNSLLKWDVSKCRLQYSGVFRCTLSSTRNPVVPPMRSNRHLRRNGTLTSSPATMLAAKSVAWSTQCGLSNAWSSSCARRRVRPHWRSSFESTPAEVNCSNIATVASRASGPLSFCEKDMMMAFFTNSWW